MFEQEVHVSREKGNVLGGARQSTLGSRLVKAVQAVWVVDQCRPSDK